MSCDAAAAIAVLWLASTGPAPTPAAEPPAAVAQEPLFADIVRRARALKVETDAFLGGDRAATPAFHQAVQALADLDMQGHLLLAKRGVDGDLKCILRGISQDLPLKLAALAAAGPGKPRAAAARELAYLLNDNVEVLTAPPRPPA